MFYVGLSIFLTELVFLLGYLLAFFVCQTVVLALVMLFRRRFSDAVRARVTGVICGSISAFLAVSVAHYFSVLAAVTGYGLIMISILLPLIGMFSYCWRLRKQVSTGYFQPAPLYERFHAAMMVVPQRSQFAYIKAILEADHPEQIGMSGDPLGHLAYNWTTSQLLVLTMLSVPGVILGILLALR